MLETIQSGKDDYVGLVIYNARKISEERNKHSRGSLRHSVNRFSQSSQTRVKNS